VPRKKKADVVALDRSTQEGALAAVRAGTYDRDCYIGRYGDIPPDKKEK